MLNFTLQPSMLNPTELCELAMKYGTDKCPQICHDYTPFYYEIFSPIQDKVRKVVEMGIGTSRYRRRLFAKPGGKNIKIEPELGASLRMWKDFFPNAQIFGADYKKETLFNRDRIKTFLCDETKIEDVENLLKETGTDIDIFIDDGSHKIEEQVFLAKTVLPRI